MSVGILPILSLCFDARASRAIERDETAGLMKIVVDAESDRILEAAILSTDGGELVQMFAPVMTAGLPYTVLKDAVYIHPLPPRGSRR
ncbi:MAG TPA: hypothetical protein VGJ20_30070 [Xanthobacteraceae bacterium]